MANFVNNPIFCRPHCNDTYIDHVAMSELILDLFGAFKVCSPYNGEY